MSNAMALKQMRNSIKTKIRKSPETITISRMPLIDDGFGGTIENPYGTPVETIMKVRISHEQSGPSKMESSSVGVSTNLQRFILTDYNSVIYKDETFTAIGKTWKIGAVDTLKRHDGIIGYQAPLIDAGVA